MVPSGRGPMFNNKLAFISAQYLNSSITSSADFCRCREEVWYAHPKAWIGMFNSAGFSLLLSQEKSAASCTFLGNPTLLKTGANDPISLSPVIKSSLPFAPVLNTTNAWGWIWWIISYISWILKSSEYWYTPPTVSNHIPAIGPYWVHNSIICVFA